jgi:acetyl-CoA synthetase
VGRKQRAIADTFWCVVASFSHYWMLSADRIDRKTEPASIVVTPLRGAIQTKPGSATVLWDQMPTRSTTSLNILVVSDSNIATIIRIQALAGTNVKGILVLRNPWLVIAHTIWGDHK